MKLIDTLHGKYGHEIDVYLNEDTGGYIFIQDEGVTYVAIDTTITSLFELKMMVEWLEGRTNG